MKQATPVTIIPANQVTTLQPASTADVLDQLATFLRINIAEGDASENTIRAYLSHVGQFVGWCWKGDLDPGHATETHLAEYRHFLSSEGYKRSTIGVKLAALRRFYQAVVWRGLRPDNPAEGLRPPRDHTTREDRVLERYLSPAEIELLLSTPDQGTATGLRDHAMMALMYSHGLRVSEVAALHLHDLVLSDPPQVHIRKSKGGKDRAIVLIDATLTTLNTWMETRASIVTKRSGLAMFLSRSKAGLGAPITAPGIRWVINQYLTATGLRRPGVSCHALRHAHASHALAGGADLYAVAREMGHTSIETTTVYMHIVDAIKQNPAEYLHRAQEMKR